MTPGDEAFQSILVQRDRLASLGWNRSPTRSKYEVAMFEDFGELDEPRRPNQGSMLRMTALGSAPGAVEISLTAHDANLSASLRIAHDRMERPLDHLLQLRR